MYSMPDLTMLALHSPVFTCDAKMLPNVESSWPGTTIGRFASAAASSQHSSGSPSNSFFGAALDQLVEVLVPEAALALLGRLDPHRHQDLLDRAERLVLGDRRVGDAAHALLEDLRVVVLGEVAVVGEVLVAVVRDEAEQRLLEVRAGDREAVDQARADRRARA
jgi:hypothetical protein